jgi:hypothetical protein
MSDKPQKISIGFHGGQVLAARVKQDDLTSLKAALGSGSWHDLTAEDGTISLDVSRIDYLLVDNGENRIGF